MSERGGRSVVLVVDDSPETLAMLTAALESADMLVLVATDGERALSAVRHAAPDLVLLDAVMPGIDGFETCRRLKLRPELADVPIVFMTGLKETDHIVKGLEAGGVDYVTKPIVLDELLARIRVHIGNARKSRSARAALDTTGRYLFAVNAAGRLVWSTPQANRLLGLAETGDNAGPKLPDAISRWVAARQDGRPDPSTLGIKLESTGATLSIAFVGRADRDEILLRVTEESGADQAAIFRERLGVTARESEVLLWIARGKSNKDIGDILGMSPRTVNKHLEQIYVKLGVENRAAAAAVAVRHMP
ncbi:DNA-binding response regulator [Methylopila jiangsuensis]|uniref:DNA-binding response regulator n=1 Tax=Methylopila jiangsuensis TaxID=586230 RepID=A0A9W6JEY0_9HYPH|nr:response regulator transcription factor [Methylopila jiangsuensis]MDR6287468.1 DNA-binding NarL/FixJ family response regulator [Methylopila jiangsuensis]GLK75048.1 DNA-binding response regulator [Methylopila jiangsuensis]